MSHCTQIARVTAVAPRRRFAIASNVRRSPKLKTLSVPIRARHRAQIVAVAETSEPFRELVKTYEWIDARK